SSGIARPIATHLLMLVSLVAPAIPPGVKSSSTVIAVSLASAWFTSVSLLCSPTGRPASAGSSSALERQFLDVPPAPTSDAGLDQATQQVNQQPSVEVAQLGQGRPQGIP